MFVDPTGFSDEDELIVNYQQMWQDAEAAYLLGIINYVEKDNLQTYVHERADKLRYQKEHPIITTFSKITEFAIFDIALGDFDGGTVYAADYTEKAAQKIYNNASNFAKVAATAVIVSYDKGRTLVNTKINGDMVRVDIEFPQGGKEGNVHVQNKKTGEKWIIKNIDELDNLPKSIAKNNKIRDALLKGLKTLSKLL